MKGGHTIKLADCGWGRFDLVATLDTWAPYAEWSEDVDNVDHFMSIS